MATQNFESFHLTDIKDKIDGKSPLLGALFLFFLFFITFLFVYFFYKCIRCGGGGSNAPSTSTGLDSAAISGLPILSYGSTTDKKLVPEAECAICLSLFQEGDKVKILPVCRHGFHPGCVDMWLKSRSSCPLCRSYVMNGLIGSEIPSFLY